MKNKMVQRESLLKVVDNCGAKIVKCVGMLEGFSKRKGKLGDFIKVSIRARDPHKELLKKEIKVYLALIAAKRRVTQRRSGHCVRFKYNSVVVLGTDQKVFGTRLRGPVAQEIRCRQIARLMVLAHRII
jgi:large subunit ribosomal protein L14